MKKEHQVILTDHEIEEIVNKVREDDFDLERSWDRRVMAYRLINVIFLGLVILFVAWWNIAAWIALVAFWLYNLIHAVALYWRSKKLYGHE